MIFFSVSKRVNFAGPRIRVRDNLIKPTAPKSEPDIERLRKEIDSLKWLAKRKQQEWDKVLSLLKLKERSLIQLERKQNLVQKVGQDFLDRIEASPVPQQQQQPATSLILTPVTPAQQTVNGLISNPTTVVAPPVVVNKVLQLSAQPLVAHTSAGQKPIILARAPQNGTILRFNPAQPQATPTIVSTKSLSVSPGPSLLCGFCKTKPGDFLCSKCNQIRYCSPSCQKNDWVTHSLICAS